MRAGKGANKGDYQHTHKDIARIRAVPAYLEQLHQIEELSMYITAYLGHQSRHRPMPTAP